jgi:capsular exopolysaccharide synthesis family protein
MHVRAFLDVLRRRSKLMAAVVLVVVALAAAATWLTTPVYESSARIYVSAPQAETASSAAGGVLAEQRVAAYVEIVDSALLSDKVTTELGLSETHNEMRAKVSASAVGETSVLEIKVRDVDASDAQAIAQSYAENLVVEAANIEAPTDDSPTPVKVTIIDPANLPLSPAFPNPVLNLTLAVIFGLVLAVALALLREVLDNTVKDVDDLGPDGPPLLGALVGESPKEHAVLVDDAPTSSPRVEAYRMLRTNVSFIDVDQHNKALVVTSPVQGDGKSSVAINLALSLASAQVKTLLIDGDLRRPRVATSLGLVPDVGLTNVLLGKITIDGAIQSYKDGHLEVLASGTIPPNAAELLQSDAMEKLLEDLRQHFEMIVIDSPPLLPVTDAAVLASRADGALVVIRHGQTTKDQWRQAQSRLEQVDAALLGVVMNMVPANDATLGYAYGAYTSTSLPTAKSKGSKRRKD